MPIKTERITSRIYHHRWQGHVTADEVLGAFELEKKLGKSDNCDKYIIIIDGSEVRTFPFNIAKMSRAFSGDELATLIYKAPSMGQTLGEIIGAMVNLSIEFFDDWDKTLQRAHQLLEENEAVMFQL